MQRICLTHTHIEHTALRNPLFTRYLIIHSAGKDRWLVKPRETEKWRGAPLTNKSPLLQESFPCSPFSRLLPALQLSCFPVKRTGGGGERRTLNNQHLCCSSVFSLSLLSSRFLQSLGGKEGGELDHQRYTAVCSTAGGSMSVTKVT